MERITFPADTLEHLRETADVGDRGFVRVRSRSAEQLIQVLGVVDSDRDVEDSENAGNEPVPVVRSRLYRNTGPRATGEVPYVVTEPSTTGRSSTRDQSDQQLHVPIDPDEAPWLQQGDERTPVTILRTDDEVFERVSDIVDTEYLSTATATIVGLGTVGSTVAVELAKSGIGEVYLYDPDTLEIHNVSRHVCDLPDVGRQKAAAVADRVRRRNPGITVHSHAVDVLENREQLRSGILDSDVVLCCTDTEHSQAVVNEEAVAAEVPSIFAGAWERGYGGQIIRSDPAHGGPCYACLFGTPDPLAQAARNDDGTIDYSQAQDAGEADFAAEPGISVDVGLIALLQTRYALATLLADKNLPVADLPADILVWGNRGKDPFKEPFENHWRRQERDPECPICRDGGLGEQLRTNVISEADTPTADVSDTEEEGPEELDIDIESDEDGWT